MAIFQIHFPKRKRIACRRSDLPSEYLDFIFRPIMARRQQSWLDNALHGAMTMLAGIFRLRRRKLSAGLAAGARDGALESMSAGEFAGLVGCLPAGGLSGRRAGRPWPGERRRSRNVPGPRPLSGAMQAMAGEQGRPWRASRALGSDASRTGGRLLHRHLGQLYRRSAGLRHRPGDSTGACRIAAPDDCPRGDRQ
jgi:hypothetical protein